MSQKVTIKTKTSSKLPLVTLRTMELSDTKVLFDIENNPLVWRYTRGGGAPYTLAEIEEFITASDTLATSGQMRFLVDFAGRVVGTVDLYDYNEIERSAWVAILIYPFALHGCGYGSAALRALMSLASELNVDCLMAEVDASNAASLALFERCGWAITHPHCVRSRSGCVRAPRDFSSRGDDMALLNNRLITLCRQR